MQKALQVFRMEFSGLVYRTVPGGPRRRRCRPRVRANHRPQHQIRRRIRFFQTG